MGTAASTSSPYIRSTESTYSSRMLSTNRSPHMSLVLVVVWAAAAAAVPIGPDVDYRESEDQYAFLVSNLSALWKEVDLLRSEIQHHLHGGSTDQEYNKALDEIEVMHHENAVHNHHRPHSHHNLHHNEDLRRHMNDAHGHHHTHLDEGEGHREHNHHHDHQQDIHDNHGLHEHEDDHDDFNSHEDRPDFSSHEDRLDHESHGGHQHNFDERVRQPSLENEESDEDDDDDSDENVFRSSHRQNSNSGIVQSQHSNHGHGGHSHGHEQSHGVNHIHDDGMTVAYCDLQPNKDMPTSNVNGLITISQRKDKKGPVYFDLDLEGFDVQRDGYLHGFHIHALPVTNDNKCGAAKGHFNPLNAHHGGPTAQTRHVGDLGNIRVDEDGELEGYILSDNFVAFAGDNSIIGKSIVVHAGEDDLGLGGAPDSLTTGAAGGRLACCNIKLQKQPRFRIKG